MSNTNSVVATKTATVVQVRESLVLIEVDDKTPLMKNEVGYVCVGDERLKAEVLRIRGRTADMQVFEDTSGVRVGDRVEMTGEMLSATLGPGLLGRVFDGLQSPLAAIAEEHGFFLPRGVAAPPLMPRSGASQTLPQASGSGGVGRPEGRPHKIRAVRRTGPGHGHLIGQGT
jgi:V/A-type H+-transporting ATPase subunit A